MKLCILLDNGHGFDTPGKRSPVWPDGSQLLEAQYARDIVNRLALKLAEAGIEFHIIVPEPEDISLKQRAARVNRIADSATGSRILLISIHVNASDDKPHARGWEVHTSLGTTVSDKYADYFWDAAKRISGNISQMRGDYQDGDKDRDSNFYILRETTCPAVLTENFFMTNEQDCRYLLSEKGKQDVVDIHFDAILKIMEDLR